MQPTHRAMTPPGVILLEDLMTPLNMTPQALAAALELPENVVVAIIRGYEPVTADVALRLASCFGTTPEFWRSAQAGYDLSKTTAS